MNSIMNLKYFEKPTQVMFANPDAPEGKCWSVGIAYKDEVIWSLNSWVFTMLEVYTAAQKRNCQNYIYPYAYWIDLTEEICGGWFPKGLARDSETRKIIEVKCD